MIGQLKAEIIAQVTETIEAGNFSLTLKPSNPLGTAHTTFDQELIQTIKQRPENKKSFLQKVESESLGRPLSRTGSNEMPNYSSAENYQLHSTAPLVSKLDLRRVNHTEYENTLQDHTHNLVSTQSQTNSNARRKDVRQILSPRVKCIVTKVTDFLNYQKSSENKTCLQRARSQLTGDYCKPSSNSIPHTPRNALSQRDPITISIVEQVRPEKEELFTSKTTQGLGYSITDRKHKSSKTTDLRSQSTEEFIKDIRRKLLNKNTPSKQNPTKADLQPSLNPTAKSSLTGHSAQPPNQPHPASRPLSLSREDIRTEQISTNPGKQMALFHPTDPLGSQICACEADPHDDSTVINFVNILNR